MTGFPHTFALFGANGQIGSFILHALLTCAKQSFTVKCFIPPGSPAPEEISGKDQAECLELDLTKISREDLAKHLQGIDVVVSALNGPALDSQILIQDAAADAGVQRFYPSEYGMHHIYRKPNDPQGYVHPLWDSKARVNEKALLHPAIESGKMSYTLIGCGDFYNQDRDPNARADFTHLSDFAEYLVATICEPEKSHNAHLNFVSDTVSHTRIAELLRTYSGKPVHVEVLPESEMHIVLARPDAAPENLRGKDVSAFPVDFWFLVKGAQGQDRFRWPLGQRANDLFPYVKKTTFETYFRQRFEKQ
ncbi:hypothetical protein EDD37DRAFT_667877 [Exophiala viscosa]|uniref:uncharacterized protein n=1 Tax=Exophiala viscosa TaxID=2486360 RepID=UPI00219957ED|nr:hypothetical protein EDD37DRAFT_667877 [Exophiala viscosa]